MKTQFEVTYIDSEETEVIEGDALQVTAAAYVILAAPVLQGAQPRIVWTAPFSSVQCISSVEDEPADPAILLSN